MHFVKNSRNGESERPEGVLVLRVFVVVVITTHVTRSNTGQTASLLYGYFWRFLEELT